MSVDPPGFGPAGQVPTLHGEPLAAPKVKGQRAFFVVMAAFAALAVAAVAGLFLSRGDEHSSSATVRGPVRVSLGPGGPRGAETSLPVGPVPKPVRYRGTGNKTVAIRKPEPGVALIYVKGNAAGKRFWVTKLGAGGAFRGLAVSEFEPYEGVRVLDQGSLNETRSLRVEATGPWTIEIRSPRSAPLLKRSAAGRSDTVLRYEGGATTATITGGKFASGAFSVRVHRGDGFTDLVMVALDRERSTEPWPAGPVLVEIEAGAPWTLALG